MKRKRFFDVIFFHSHFLEPAGVASTFSDIGSRKLLFSFFCAEEAHKISILTDTCINNKKLYGKFNEW